MITIIDYGVGNLFSLSSSLSYLGLENKVSRDPEDLRKADHIILPGVGAYGDAIAKLRGSGMAEPLLDEAKAGKPIMGICLGMQIAVIEYARNVVGIKDANSGEFDEQCKHKVINFMPGQNDNIDKGGTLRLGAYPCNIQAGTTMHRCYGVDTISERHRHRYEFNNDYREQITLSGLTVSGTSPDGRLVETVEITDRPFHVGVQYHPEFKSRPNRPHPLFKGFIQAALSHQSGGNL